MELVRSKTALSQYLDRSQVTFSTILPLSNQLDKSFLTINETGLDVTIQFLHSSRNSVVKLTITCEIRLGLLQRLS